MGKLFGTDGIRGKANTYPMTVEIALKLGQAIAAVFSHAKKTKVLIGKDTRISGYIFENALTAGLCSMGTDVYLLGPMPTPAVAHLTRSFGAAAGIMISASHNPAEDNGIKIFSEKGIKLPDTIEMKIEQLILSNSLTTEHVPAAKIGKAHRLEEAKGRYIEFAKTTIHDASLQGLKIALDCANGAAYHVAPIILRELGAEVIALHTTPDGLNINKECGALHLETLQKAVKDHNADVGIALDGDADRVIMVDEHGEQVNGDHILAICGLELLKNKRLNKKTVVATVYSNLGLDETFRQAGARVVRVNNGDRYVIEEMIKHTYILGGEQSGHIIFGEYNPTGDGMIAALHVVHIMQQTHKKLSVLKQCLIAYPQVLLHVPVREKKPLEHLKPLQEALHNVEKKLGNEGRVLIRYSGTEMILRVMVEGKHKKLVEESAADIARTAKKLMGR